MFEVHTGARPGRPVVLLISTAVVLSITLGVARLQVASKSALGPPVALRGSPFLVRPPKGWAESKDQPGRFFLASEVRGLFSEWQDQRAVEFHYVMMYPGVTPADAAAFLVDNVGELIKDARSAAIGPWDGIEFQRTGALIQGNHAVARIEICRVAVSPRGDAILAQYRTFGTPTLGDLTRFDDICDAVTLAPDAAIYATQDEAARRAGLRLRPLSDWTFLRPSLDATPGLFAVRNDKAAPITVEVVRTWLSANRTPRALALDFAAERWNRHPTSFELHDVDIDGALSAIAINRPADVADRSALLQIGAIARDEDVFLYCAYSHKLDPNEAGTIVGELFRNAAIEPLANYDDLDVALQNGRRVIDQIRDNGIAHYWPEPSQRDVFAGDDGMTQIRQERARRIRRTAGETIHEGEATLVFVSPAIAKPVILYHEQWNTNSDGTKFELSGTLPLEQPPLEFAESRETETGLVTRQLRGNKGRRYTYQPGPNFVVDPPLGELVRLELALGEDRQILIESPAIRGSTTAFELLTVTERTGDRVTIFAQADFRPEGILHIMNRRTGELLETKSPRTHLLRVTPPQ